MELKIFKAGFGGMIDAVAFNEFIATHITQKLHFLDNGNVYVLYKDITKLGLDRISKIETLDGLQSQAGKEILAHELDKSDQLTKIADLKEKLSKQDLLPEDKKRIESELAQTEIKVRMDDATIEDRRRQIGTFQDSLRDTLSSAE